MNMYHRYLFPLLLLTFISHDTFTAWCIRNKRNTSPTEQTVVNASDKPIIIFDLINVLFKESYTGFAQKIGYAKLANYAITHWKNPGHRCLDMLDAISNQELQKPSVTIQLSGRTMPLCIVELHEGKKTCNQVNNEINQAVELLNQNKFFASDKEKNLMLTIMNLMLDPQTIAQVTEPIKQVVSLAQKLKQNGYSLYLFANIPDEFYAALQTKYPSVLALFDGVVVSAQNNMVKPHKQFFEHLFTTHNLNPQQCILIDAFTENVSAAQSLGMRAIVYEKPSSLTKYLKTQRIIV